MELEKDTTEGGDINSSIRSKNKISKKVESQVIKSMSIDNKINEYKKWQKLIDDFLQELRKYDDSNELLRVFNILITPELNLLYKSTDGLLKKEKIAKIQQKINNKNNESK